ncbi:nuclear protein Es2-domain-containing protein [Cokeromyces recurvatus]|uniref:nuclear protein Es2-domain-containing protein n=1 Tax=Cokeromyces recurvatus TaxID=90255 RepID=UPI002220AF0F|nr:nuclear protein Es2-domain-containing protein [Cokeromyces recurvatus]KAI7903055.1 nuclear protein Es2-domain-containing protein [Cokeromyces recurvatus]
MTTPVVLDEDTYTEAISLIIERDFFPNLAKMKAEQKYWEVQKNGSLAELQEAGRALHNATTLKKSQPRDSNQSVNYYFEDEPDIEKRVNLNLSLDQFQSLYTSEDNASFADLLEKANLKVKEKNKWFFDRESLRITNGEKGTLAIETNEKAPLGWKYKTRNALMYYPEGKSESWVNPNEGRGQPKSIEYKNTHIMINDTSLPTHKTVAPSDIANKDGSLTPWKQWNGLSSTEADDSTPNIRGYNLVDATPTLSPSRIGTPQMTWGSIEGTPLLISNGSDTPEPQFSLPKISKREQLGMKLSEKASKAYRKKTIERQQRRIQGTPRVGAGLMSPAAQHLLRKSTQGFTPRIQSGFGEALRSTYNSGSPSFKTPRSILKRPGATPTPIALFRAGATPQKKEKN